ncbi:MAG: translation initiation factor 1 [Luteibaculaceae bacterium]
MLPTQNSPLNTPYSIPPTNSSLLNPPNSKLNTQNSILKTIYYLCGMAKSSKKNRVNVVYSTNPDFSYESEDESDATTLASAEQNLRVMVDRKQRKGKEVTLVTDFVGTDEDLKDLGKKLKQRCGVGGAAKDGEIMIQGNFKVKVLELLAEWGYKAKPVGGN